MRFVIGVSKGSMIPVGKIEKDCMGAGFEVDEYAVVEALPQIEGFSASISTRAQKVAERMLKYWCCFEPQVYIGIAGGTQIGPGSKYSDGGVWVAYAAIINSCDNYPKHVMLNPGNIHHHVRKTLLPPEQHNSGVPLPTLPEASQSILLLVRKELGIA